MRHKVTPPELNDPQRLRIIAATYWPSPTNIEQLKLPAYRPYKIDHICHYCGSHNMWHLAGPRNLKLQCEKCRHLYFPRAGSIEKAIQISKLPPYKLLGITCDADCEYQVGNKCKSQFQSINSSRICETYIEIGSK